MSAYCERCGREWKHIPDGHSAPGFACKTCNPPRKVPLRYYVRSYIAGIPDLLDDFGIWLNYGTSYLRYPAWWALIFLGAFCAVNAVIIFAMLIKWLWGF